MKNYQAKIVHENGSFIIHVHVGMDLNRSCQNERLYVYSKNERVFSSVSCVVMNVLLFDCTDLCTLRRGNGLRTTLTQ